MGLNPGLSTHGSASERVSEWKMETKCTTLLSRGKEGFSKAVCACEGPSIALGRSRSSTGGVLARSDCRQGDLA